MATKTIHLGPFTNDQMEMFLRELQIKNIPYEAHKPQADWVTVAKSDIPKVSGRLAQIGVEIESSFDVPKEQFASMSAVERQKKKDVFDQAKSEKKKFNQKLLVLILLLGVLCLGVIVAAIL